MVEIKDNKDLDKYIKEFNEDVKVTDFNIREKSLTSSAIWAKWLSYLYHEKENLTRIGNAKQKILKKKLSTVKQQDSVLRMKSEEKLQETDETVLKLNSLNKMTLDNIDYIERCLGILANFGFNIKNALEAIKLVSSH